MTLDWIAAAKTFLSWFPDKYKTMFAFVLVAGLLLWLPWPVLTAMHVEQIAADHRLLEWLVFLFGSTLLVLSGLENWGKKWNRYRSVKSRLSRMTAEEKQTVRSLFEGERGGVMAWPYEARVTHLHRDGILWRSPDGLQNDMYAYGLTDAARRRIKPHHLM